MNLTVHLALVFRVFIAVDVMVIVSGRHGIGPMEVTYWPALIYSSISTTATFVAVVNPGTCILFLFARRRYLSIFGILLLTN